MKIIKLGGSLLSDQAVLKQCLSHIEQSQKNKQTLIIVPGGGVFAELVRTTQQKWAFDEETAHSMAILAMQQMALFLSSLAPSFILAESIAEIQKIRLNHSSMIWSPSLRELNTCVTPKNWEVTSDSLAAWLANQLDTKELILVKSTPIPEEVDLHQMQEQGIVDKAFNQFTQSALYNITLINKYKFNEYSLL